MDLNILNKQIGDVSVVALKGRIVLGEGSSALREQIKSLVDDGKKKIVLNMANVTYIDSAGLGTLVAALVRFVKQVLRGAANNETADGVQRVRYRSRSYQ